MITAAVAVSASIAINADLVWEEVADAVDSVNAHGMPKAKSTTARGIGITSQSGISLDYL